MKTYYFTLSYGVNVQGEDEDEAADNAIMAMQDGNVDWEQVQLTDVDDDEEDVDLGGEG